MIKMLVRQASATTPRDPAFMRRLREFILTVLGLGSFVVAGFMFAPIAGFVVLGVAILLLAYTLDDETPS